MGNSTGTPYLAHDPILELDRWTPSSTAPLLGPFLQPGGCYIKDSHLQSVNQGLGLAPLAYPQLTFK